MRHVVFISLMYTAFFRFELSERSNKDWKGFFLYRMIVCRVCLYDTHLPLLCGLRRLCAPSCHMCTLGDSPWHWYYHVPFLALLSSVCLEGVFTMTSRGPSPWLSGVYLTSNCCHSLKRRAFFACVCLCTEHKCCSVTLNDWYTQQFSPYMLFHNCCQTVLTTRVMYTGCDILIIYSREGAYFERRRCQWCSSSVHNVTVCYHKDLSLFRILSSVMDLQPSRTSHRTKNMYISKLYDVVMLVLGKDSGMFSVLIVVCSDHFPFIFFFFFV